MMWCLQFLYHIKWVLIYPLQLNLGKCGMKYHDIHPYLLASTDGYIETVHGLEYAEVKVIVKDESATLESKLAEFTCQIQLGMQIHKCPRCHFIVYDLRKDGGTQMSLDTRRLHSKIVERDDKWFECCLFNASQCNVSYLQWFQRKTFDQESAEKILNELFK